jgi:hypothetical protein
MREKDNWNIEQYIAFSIPRANLKGQVRFFPFIMYSAREWGGSTSWSQGVWSDQKGYYIKYGAEFQSASSAKLVFKDRSHWDKFFANDPGIGFNCRIKDTQGNLFVKNENGLFKITTSQEVSSKDFILSIHYSSNVGLLYSSAYEYGNCDKHHFDVVDIVPLDSGGYSLISQSDHAPYLIDPDGLIEKSSISRASFNIENKYTY